MLSYLKIEDLTRKKPGVGARRNAQLALNAPLRLFADRVKLKDALAACQAMYDLKCGLVDIPRRALAELMIRASAATAGFWRLIPAPTLRWISSGEHAQYSTDKTQLRAPNLFHSVHLAWRKYEGAQVSQLRGLRIKVAASLCHSTGNGIRKSTSCS